MPSSSLAFLSFLDTAPPLHPHSSSISSVQFLLHPFLSTILTPSARHSHPSCFSSPLLPGGNYSLCLISPTLLSYARLPHSLHPCLSFRLLPSTLSHLTSHTPLFHNLALFTYTFLICAPRLLVPQTALSQPPASSSLLSTLSFPTLTFGQRIHKEGKQKASNW